MKTLVIYHDACRDGFCAAWCVWRRLPTCEFLPVQYGQLAPDVSGRVVIMVDFSYPLDVMRDIAKNCASLVVLDHHKTAEAALRDFSAPNAHVTFDMNRSGAGLAWDHFFMDSPRPWIVDYVEDRDLWRFKLPESKAVNEWLSVVEFDFATWDRESNGSVEAAAKLGAAIAMKTALHVSLAVKHARMVVFEGYSVPLLNVTSDISEVVGKLAEDNQFAIGWFQTGDGKFVYSLRSRGDFDVSALAKKHGGGGHKNAAGFQAMTQVIS